MTDFFAIQAALHCQAPRRLSFGECKVHLARLGIELRKTEFKEYRVNYLHGAEVTAVYELELRAAVENGLALLSAKAALPVASIAARALATLQISRES